MVAGLLLVVTGLAGCRVRSHVTVHYDGPAPTPAGVGHTIPVGSSTQVITVDGLPRTFHLFRPATLPAMAPLVVMLHGGYGSGLQAEGSYGWDAEAALGHFIVSYPDGINHVWNAGGGCCGEAARDNINDVGFITQMVAAIEQEVPIDKARVFATGISNGGILAYDLACNTEIFAAIGPDSATELATCPSPAPISIIHIHGTADPIIKYDGGPGQNVGAVIDGPAIPALNARWRAIDQCAPPVVSVSGLVTTSIADCPSNRQVELITIAGAGHQWPGGAPNALGQRILHTAPPSTALNATAVIWQFFAAHAKA